MLRLLFRIHLAVIATATPLFSICSEQPAIRLVAGDNLDFELVHCPLPRTSKIEWPTLTLGSINNAFNVTCEATLVYSDAGFLPSSFIFEPILYAGIQTARMLVPLGSPNGNARVSLYTNLPLPIHSFQ